MKNKKTRSSKGQDQIDQAETDFQEKAARYRKITHAQKDDIKQNVRKFLERVPRWQPTTLALLEMAIEDVIEIHGPDDTAHYIGTVIRRLLKAKLN